MLMYKIGGSIMTILMGIAVHPKDEKPYALMVSDSMSTELVFNSSKEVSGTKINEDIKKLHKFHNNLIIGFEGMLVGDVHHKVINSLQNIIDPNDDLHAIHSKVVKEIVRNFRETELSEAQYSVIMCGFIDGIPSLNKVVFLNKSIIENVFQKPNKGTFLPIFDPQSTPEMVEKFRNKVLQYNPNNISLFRKAFVDLAKEVSKLSIGSNDNIKVERLR